LRTGVAVVDLMTGMYATSAVLAALVQRGRSGLGQHLDIALLDVAVAMNANQGSNFLVSGEKPVRIGNMHPNLAPYEVFECSDGHIILAIGNDTQFSAFCKLMKSEWHLQPEFATNAGRLTNLAQLRPLLRAVLMHWRTADLGLALDINGISWGSINSLEQVFQHPQVIHRQMLQTVEHPELESSNSCAILCCPRVRDCRFVHRPRWGQPAAAASAAEPFPVSLPADERCRC
jgi:crotonobetainyl-CoA:carnitine CoA-transferase CaiB-like acyl-CoA transferase